MSGGPPPATDNPSLARLRELEGGLEHTIPPEGGADSRMLFRAMTGRSLALLEAAPGARVLDLACGMGQDTLALAGRCHGVGGAGLTVGAEPLSRMIRWGRERARERCAEGAPPPRLAWVRGFAEALPFREASFDAVLCKGAMDHFPSPAAAMAEIGRILKPGGRAVLAIANYDSLSCRLGRVRDRRRAARDSAFVPEGRPYHEPPPDHLTRFGYGDIVALVRSPLRPARVEGLSLLWGFPPWGALLERLPGRARRAALGLAFTTARLVRAWADVIVVQARKAP